MGNVPKKSCTIHMNLNVINLNFKCDADQCFLSDIKCRTYFLAYNLLQALIHIHTFSFMWLGR